jgi:hypothetical protein
MLLSYLGLSPWQKAHLPSGGDTPHQGTTDT